MNTRMYSDTEICLKCVDDNEIIYDGDQTIIKKIESEILNCPEILFEDILRNIEKCEQVMLWIIQQRTILNETRVRFDSKNDVAGIQGKIAEMGLTKTCAEYLRDTSDIGYKVLKKNYFFDHSVEFDTERHGSIAIHGKKKRIIAYPGMVTLMNQIPTQGDNTERITKCKPSRKRNNGKIPESDEMIANKLTELKPTRKGNDKVLESEDIIAKSSKEKSELTFTRKKCKRITSKTTAKDDETKNSNSKREKLEAKETKGTKEAKMTEEAKETKEAKEIKEAKETKETKELERVVVSVIVTARSHIKALDVLKNIIYYKILPATHFYLLVYHLGPLVDKQEVVLYKLYIPEEILTMINTTQTYSDIATQRNNDEKLNFEPFTVSQTVQQTAYLHTDFSIEENAIKSCDLDLSQLEAEFKKVMGHRLQQASPLRDYFRYLVYDTPGIKDHTKDAKERFERYMDKKQQKKMMKKNKQDRMKTLPDNENEVEN